MKIFCLKYLSAAVAVLCIVCSCSKSEQPYYEECPDIIFDSDLGNSTDDVLAMHALFHAQSIGECRVVGAMSSRKVKKSQDLFDRFMHYYKADSVPLGLVEGEAQFFEIIPYYQLVDSLKSDGSPLFEPTGIPLSDRLPAWKLYRKLLGEAKDGSITIVCVGMFTNLGLLLDSAPDEYSALSGKELVSKKVKELDLMGGCFTEVPLRYSKGFLTAEYNISGDVPLAKKVVEEWPSKVCMMPLEVGMSFPSNHDEVLSAYAWQPESPMYQIYSRYDEWAKGDVGQYWWDALAVMHAVYGEDLFSCSDPGYIHIDDTGVTTFEVDGKGNAHLVGMNPERIQNMNMLLEALSGFSR